jgi:hypothetical protein
LSFGGAHAPLTLSTNPTARIDSDHHSNLATRRVALERASADDGRMRRTVPLAGAFIAGGLLIAGCSGSNSTELPVAFDRVCTPERGCQITSAVAEAACDELGNPDRIGLRVGATAIESIAVYETYPSVVALPQPYPSVVARSTGASVDTAYPEVAMVKDDLRYPVIPRTFDWNQMIDCTVFT